MALDITAADEVIMPAYTFVSTANAIALRGGTPVFVDVDPETLNIDTTKIEAAITAKTKAILVVHYAGVSCDMDALVALCEEHKVVLLEDAAQALSSSWKGKPLGSFGTFGAVSFHHTKNVTCGEGGALLINDSAYVSTCEIIQDKGTDRAKFLRGDINKYEWHSLGSSFLLSELAAAVLASQLNRAEELKRKRIKVWQRYHQCFGQLKHVRTPRISEHSDHNAHIYHLRLPTAALMLALKNYCADNGIIVAPHYVPLHETTGGQDFGRHVGTMTHTCEAAATLLRLPLFASMTAVEQDHVLETVMRFFNSNQID